MNDSDYMWDLCDLMVARYRQSEDRAAYILRATKGDPNAQLTMAVYLSMGIIRTADRGDWFEDVRPFAQAILPDRAEQWIKSVREGMVRTGLVPFTERLEDA